MNHVFRLKTAAALAPLLGAGSLGSVIGYRHADDDHKLEGAYRGGVMGASTLSGAVSGGVLGSILGAKSSVNAPQDARALAILLSALGGAGVGGGLGFGASRLALGPQSESKTKPSFTDEDTGEEESYADAKIASILAKVRLSSVISR